MELAPPVQHGGQPTPKTQYIIIRSVLRMVVFQQQPMMPVFPWASEGYSWDGCAYPWYWQYATVGDAGVSQLPYSSSSPASCSPTATTSPSLAQHDDNNYPAADGSTLMSSVLAGLTGDWQPLPAERANAEQHNDQDHTESDQGKDSALNEAFDPALASAVHDDAEEELVQTGTEEVSMEPAVQEPSCNEQQQQQQQQQQQLQQQQQQQEIDGLTKEITFLFKKLTKIEMLFQKRVDTEVSREVLRTLHENEEGDQGIALGDLVSTNKRNNTAINGQTAKNPSAEEVLNELLVQQESCNEIADLVHELNVYYNKLCEIDMYFQELGDCGEYKDCPEFAEVTREVNTILQAKTLDATEEHENEEILIPEAKRKVHDGFRMKRYVFVRDPGSEGKADNENRPQWMEARKVCVNDGKSCSQTTLPEFVAGAPLPPILTHFAIEAIRSLGSDKCATAFRELQGISEYVKHQVACFMYEHCEGDVHFVAQFLEKLMRANSVTWKTPVQPA